MPATGDGNLVGGYVGEPSVAPTVPARVAMPPCLRYGVGRICMPGRWRATPGSAVRSADLLPQRRGDVYVEDIGDLQKVGKDVRDLLTDPFRLPRPRHDGSRLLRSEPLEDFDQLADLTGERHDQVLGGVKSLPVPLYAGWAQGR